MRSGTSYPYHRLTDLDVSRERPVSVGGLSRAVTAALIVGAVCIAVMLSVLGGLVALYLSGAAPKESGDGPPTAQALRRRLSALEREVAELRELCRRGFAEGGPVGEPGGTDRPSERDRSLLVSSSAFPAAEVASDRDFAGADATESEQTGILAPEDGITDPEDGTVDGLHGAVPGARSPDRTPPAEPRRLPRSKDRRGGPRQPADHQRRGAGGRQRDDGVPAPDEAGVGQTEAEAEGRAGSEAEGEPRRNRKKGREETGRRNPGRNQRMSEPSPVRPGKDKDSRCRQCNAPSVFGQAIHIRGMRDGNIFIENDGWIRGFGMWEVVDVMDGTEEYFSFGPMGAVTVLEGGVYYVYSQILFYDSNATVGQSIYVSGAARFTCTKSNISAEAKQSTCYVGGLVRMSAGDTVAIKLSVHSLTVALYSDTSYFGLFRVA